ncbi:3-methyl-2-oxobutanoate hydroxymethyltransferase [Staphylococcus succinus]|uniref:3-methyl-2-oxobutanoate hydroxymethyltransferase n=1 Tax=Staphylococcus succinus TaxID=61015 RepID=UPI000C330E97|nr:3-methyl-2-oxobutanoate hydroxymethyltransferase [Staphylococcus succinus]MEB7462860.1 3-methyl-2-oxobutanoate hydroxymethyltransferase [Staphylococcus succinus]PKI21386.1 3-methyl-2-oxobutanoate hydroxymethyltransferase [Staphylococcus succinus]
MKTLNQLMTMKQNNEKLSMITAYDFPSAKQAEAAQIDTILVGDSLGMTVLGYESTVQVTIEDMIHHAKAVRRGAPNTYVIVDVPFGAVGLNEQYDLELAVKLYRDTQANALKAEGAHLTQYIKNCRNMGIPIVSHLGLTPQSVGITGYKMQASTKAAAQQLVDDALAVQQAGASMIVLEAVPSDLAQDITLKLDIPVIGIGAGNSTDGQVLVYHDVLNYGVEHQAKFVKQYGDFSVGTEALAKYNEEVKAQQFPDAAHTYKKQVLEAGEESE